MKSNRKLIRFCVKATCASIGSVVGGFAGGAFGLALGEFIVPGLIEGIADTAAEQAFQFAGGIVGTACGGLLGEEVAEVINSDNSKISCYVYNLHYQGGQDAHPTIILKKY